MDVDEDGPARDTHRRDECWEVEELCHLFRCALDSAAGKPEGRLLRLELSCRGFVSSPSGPYERAFLLEISSHIL
jgi:hypothetical protein